MGPRRPAAASDRQFYSQFFPHGTARRLAACLGFGVVSSVTATASGFLSFSNTPREPETHPCNVLHSPSYGFHFKRVLDFGEGQPSEMVTANGKDKPTLAIAKEKTQPVDWGAFLAGISRGKIVLQYGANRTIFAQGDQADIVWYLERSKVKLAMTSPRGKEAIGTVLSDNEFFGEGCLACQVLRIAKSAALPERPRS